MARRYALGAGFSSAQIDHGELSEADALLLMQPSEAVHQWAAAIMPIEDPGKTFEPFTKSGVVKELKV